MTEELAAKLAQAAHDADRVQDACNLSGVSRAFTDILNDVLWPAARELNKGTDWVNQHPVSVLFIDKMSSLARTQHNSGRVFQAYAACRKIAGGTATGWEE